MSNQDGNTYFSLGINHAQLERDAARAAKIFNSIGDDVEREGKRIDATFENMGKAAAAYFSLSAIKNFGQEIINVRRDIESFEISFNTLLGSKEKGSAFFEELKEFAVRTPLQLNDLASAAQTLLGFGIEAERVMPILRQLGDVSMGNASRFQSLALAFSQATSAGKLQGQDLLQMINAGFNPLNEISKKTGKSIGELKKEMSEGKISAKDLADALAGATTQGGQFYGMLQKQSKGMDGAISNLEGAWQDALNNIGTKHQETITDAIQLATTAVENYDVFINTILSLAAAYGTYKAILMATYVVQKTQAFAGSIQAIINTRKELGLLTATQKAFNGAAWANPYLLLATAVVGVVTALVLFNKTEDETQSKIDACNDRIKEQEKELERLKKQKTDLSDIEKSSAKSTAEEINQIELLSNAIHDETASIEDRQKAIRQMQGIIPNYHAELDDEGRLHRENKQAIDDHIESLNRLAMAKALQAKREELVSQKVNAELDRRIAKKDEADAQDDVNQKQEQVNRDRADYNQQMNDYHNATNGSDNWFVAGAFAGAEGSVTMRGASAINRTALDASEKALQLSEAVLKEAQGKVEIADQIIANSTEQIAHLDGMMSDYDEELKKIGAGNGTATTPTANGKQTALRSKHDEENRRAFIDLQLSAEQARIDAMAEGGEKVLAQMELNHAKEMEELEREKTDYLQRKRENAEAEFKANPANKDKTFDASAITLSPDEEKAFNNRKFQTEQKHFNERTNLVDEEARKLNEYLKQYGSYLEKRNATIALYNEQMAKTSSQAEKKTLAAQLREELSELDIEANKATSAISQLFGDMTDKTVSDMKSIADEAEKALAFLISGEWDEQKGMEFGMTKETFDTLRQSPEELEKIRKGIYDVRNEADAAEGAFKKMANGLKDIFAAKDVGQLRKALDEVESGLNEVLAVGGFLSDTLSSLGEAYGNDTLTGIADGINVAMDAASSAMSGAQAGAMFGPWGAAIGGCIGLVSSLATSFAKIGDGKHEKKIEALQGRIDKLKTDYDALGKAIEKAYSSDKAQKIEEQNANLEQQKALIQQQIEEEKSKKNADSERIAEMEAQIASIDEAIASNKSAAVDAIFGEDLKSAIDNFSSSYAEAWASGRNRAESAKEYVKNMMRQMVTESIKAAIESSGKMEAIRAKLAEFYKDGILTDAEQAAIMKDAEDLANSIDNQFGWADGLMSDKQGANQNSTRGGFEAMNQETGSELNGRFTAVQLNTEQMKVSTLDIGVDVKAIRMQIESNREIANEIRGIAHIAINHLERIEANTELIKDTNERLDTMIGYLKHL